MTVIDAVSRLCRQMVPRLFVGLFHFETKLDVFAKDLPEIIDIVFKLANQGRPEIEFVGGSGEAFPAIFTRRSRAPLPALAPETSSGKSANRNRNASLFSHTSLGAVIIHY